LRAISGGGATAFASRSKDDAAVDVGALGALVHFLEREARGGATPAPEQA
jgi:hypothetical protein